MSPTALLPRSYTCDSDGYCHNTTSVAVIIVIIVVILIIKIIFWIAVCAYIKRRRAARRTQVAYQGNWNNNSGQPLNNMNAPGPDASNYPPPPPAYYGQQQYSREAEGSPEVKGGQPNVAHVV